MSHGGRDGPNGSAGGAVGILQAVAEATRLREGAEGVGAVLRAIYRLGPARLHEVAREVRLPLPVATAVRRELERRGILERAHGVSLSPAGRSFVETELGLSPRMSFTCPTCEGTGWVVPERLTAELARLLEQAPPVDVTLDQAPCTPETAMRRVALMDEAGAVEGRRILILGDDDSVSLALCLFSRAASGRVPDMSIAVVELDPGRVAFLRHVAAREGWPIEIVEHDLREPLPGALTGRFDVFETDPPYTLP